MPQTPIPLMLTSIRLPVDLVQRLDRVAAAESINRSEAVRLAVSAFLEEREARVSRSEAERALAVLQRLVRQAPS